MGTATWEGTFEQGLFVSSSWLLIVVVVVVVALVGVWYWTRGRKGPAA